MPPAMVPGSGDAGTKQLTRLSRSGGAVGREGGEPAPWVAADDWIQINDSTMSTVAIALTVSIIK
jgi:hypothetical protein